MDSVQKARRLRRSMTEAETLLWTRLRNRQFRNLKFRRQAPIGPFVADFYCHELRLIVEADGGQHGEDADRLRTRRLESEGYRIVWFWNHEILSNIDGVLARLEEHCFPSSNCG